MKPERFAAGQFVTKCTGDEREEGVVVSRYSPRAKVDYLTVSITKGKRKGSLEFPERGWTVDHGSLGGNVRPAHEPEDYLGSEDWKIKHHAKD